MIEIESLEEFDRAVARTREHRRSMSGWQVQDLDLTGREDALLELDPRGSLFLGCTISDDVADRLRAGGALLFPAVPDVPFDPWRAQLYTPAELYDGLEKGYEHTPDARIYAWSRAGARATTCAGCSPSPCTTAPIDDALDEFTGKRRIVGVMGGHALTRDGPGVRRRGPSRPRPRRQRAHRRDRRRPGRDGGRQPRSPPGRRRRRPSSTGCSTTIAEGARPSAPTSPPGRGPRSTPCGDLADSGRSLGIPTWHYGHEPPNAFSSVVAKYFRNAIREDVLLAGQPRRDRVPARRGGHGAGDLPGGVQQLLRGRGRGGADGVRRGATTGPRTLPAWPLVEVLAAGRPFAARAHLVGTTEEALGLLVQEG